MDVILEDGGGGKSYELYSHLQVVCIIRVSTM